MLLSVYSFVNCLFFSGEFGFVMMIYVYCRMSNNSIIPPVKTIFPLVDRQCRRQQNRDGRESVRLTRLLASEIECRNRNLNYISKVNVFSYSFHGSVCVNSLQIMLYFALSCDSHPMAQKRLHQINRRWCHSIILLLIMMERLHIHTYVTYDMWIHTRCFWTALSDTPTCREQINRLARTNTGNFCSQHAHVRCGRCLVSFGSSHFWRHWIIGLAIENEFNINFMCIWS